MEEEGSRGLWCLEVEDGTSPWCLEDGSPAVLWCREEDDGPETWDLEIDDPAVSSCLYCDSIMVL